MLRASSDAPCRPQGENRTMRRAKVARGESFATPSGRVKDHGNSSLRRDHPKVGEAPSGQRPGLRERKKARLRQEIMKIAIKLFRKHGYENTRVDDIVQILEISQPTFFRYFPSKDAVLREVGRRGFACIKEHLETELSSSVPTEERLRRMYQGMAHEVESDRPLWQAVVLSGAMDPVRSPDMRKHEEVAVSLLRDVLVEGQKRGEVTSAYPVAHLAQFMEGMCTTAVRRWAIDLTGPHSLSARVGSAVEFFLRGIQP
jgi:AcrR family transcriptional regulator